MAKRKKASTHSKLTDKSKKSKKSDNPDKIKEYKVRVKNYVVDDVGQHEVEFMGKKQPVYIFSADGTDGSSGEVAAMSWSAMMTAKDSLVATGAFASLFGSFSTSIQRKIIDYLKLKGVRPFLLHTPRRLKEFHLSPRRAPSKFHHDDHVLYFGVTLMLLFKQVTEANFEGFVRSRLLALAGKQGYQPERRDNLRYPLSLDDIHTLRHELSGQYQLKKEILMYLLWASAESHIFGGVARYICSIVQWNEMTIFVLINNYLGASGSPILRRMEVAHEAKAYADAVIALAKSPCPQYFKYFCDPAEEQLMDRQNFRVLGAVVKMLMRKQNKNTSIINFAGTTEEDSVLANQLLKEHEAYAKNYRQNIMSTVNTVIQGKNVKFAPQLVPDLLNENDGDESNSSSSSSSSSNSDG